MTVLDLAGSAPDVGGADGEGGGEGGEEGVGGGVFIRGSFPKASGIKSILICVQWGVNDIHITSINWNALVSP